MLVRVISVLLLEAFLWHLWIEMAEKTHYTPATQLLESSLWRVEQQLYRTTAIGPMFYHVTSPAFTYQRTAQSTQSTRSTHSLINTPHFNSNRTFALRTLPHCACETQLFNIFGNNSFSHSLYSNTLPNPH